MDGQEKDSGGQAGQSELNTQSQSDILQALARIIEFQTGAQASSSNQPRSTIHEQFMKLQPPTFSGGVEPLEAEEWLKRMESIFDVMSVSDDQKVTLAPFMLKDQARFLWEATKGLLTTPAIGELQPPVPKKVTWKEFIAAFNEQYFPLLYRYDMEHEFSSLRQGSMSVAEYDAKFIKLSRFAPDLIHTEDAKCRRFQFGLDPDIRAGVATHEAKRYSDLVHKSKISEKSVNEKKERQTQYRKGRFEAGSARQRFQGSQLSGV
ncbi:uncharacterized protein LOC131298572 [Rhododendron vialii]|uniref:uncharacterized protein LOC131298572 n=1 Tax=Rhododendron vialii TaxID=182163 RepID=UPI00265F9574|nr:uncharacterized protein LOC131298572 [Rhododendron vialii]